jgi:glycosyltransferase involved in cell wall biosynthesis
MERPRVAGKFLHLDGHRLGFRVKGVTYGAFKPQPDSIQFPTPERVAEDFRAMAVAGFNTVRTYTVPPAWLLDQAAQSGLRVMVGLPWEQHITFLDDPGRPDRIEEGVIEGVRRCAGHPAVLCYAVGNEIPASIVRWHGGRAIERFIHRLYRAAKRTDPAALVTYVNYPTTEYLRLPFLDLHCFNVFLEEPRALERYLARLQNIASDKPLILAEIGLDSRRNGLDGQAMSLAWQVDKALRAGCAGAVVFAWTDEWYRGGEEVWDWDFGLTDRLRRPKPALSAVSRSLARPPADLISRPPRITVAVCAHNAAATIDECLEGISNLDYPDYEVIVVDDGSSDDTAEIAGRHRVDLVRTENRGLSGARNTALARATGDIIAYIDSDAYPHEDWLAFLAEAYSDKSYTGVGGPNVLPPDAGDMEECVAHAPGGPIHVLIDDDHAEHIPGCNMSFRVDALRSVGGFDSQFRIAGDDVDICWRIQDAGGTIGYKAAAMVFHHRRDTLSAYFRQQLNYGRAEAMLERKWPARYNEYGHPTWVGRVYGNGRMLPLMRQRWRVYYGMRGSAAFQPAVENGCRPFNVLPLMPEWFIVVAAVAGLSLLGVLWWPLLAFLPIALGLTAVLIGQAVASARLADLRHRNSGGWGQVRRRTMIAFLHLVQPLARLMGRLGSNLTPWKMRGVAGIGFPRERVIALWSERWHSPQTWLDGLEVQLRRRRVVVRSGGPHDRWDLEAWCGLLGGVRALIASEDHAGGKQLLRVRMRPCHTPKLVLFTLVMVSLAVLAALGGVWLVTAILVGIAGLANARLFFERGAALRSMEVCMVELRETFEAAEVRPPEPTGIEMESQPELTVQSASHLPNR